MPVRLKIDPQLAGSQVDPIRDQYPLPLDRPSFFFFSATEST